MARIPLNLPTNIDICAVDFEAVEFRRVLVQHGLPLDWDWFVSCPCQQIQTAPGSRVVLTAENPLRCAGCKGSGVLFVERHSTIGMLMDSTQEVRFANIFARYAVGSVMITLLPEHVPALGDRFTLKAGICVYEELMTHEGTRERPRYPVVKRPLWVGVDDEPGAVELKTYDVLYCRAADAKGNLTDTVYVSGTHFTVDDDGFIVWVEDEAPPVGVRLAIRYFGRPVYAVRGFPHTRRDLYLNNVPEMDNRFLAQHPVRVICEPEFLGARNPPVVADTTAAHPDIVDPNLP